MAEYFGTYEVSFTDQCGSSGSCVIVTQRCETKVPNVFTPDGNGKNDSFEIAGIEGFRGSTLQVFDRWGKLVLEEKDYRNNWDAKDNPDGVYFYIFTRSDGEVFTGHFEKMGGK
jgi:gliding motility-associated-like protein